MPSSNAWIDRLAAVVQFFGLSVIDSVRQLYCAACGAVVCVCSGCDRGQTYCAPHSFSRRRPSVVAAARVRYARSVQGRRRAAQRKLRQRVRDDARRRGQPVPAWAQIRATFPERLSASATRVTDTGSPPVASSVIVPLSMTTTVPPVAVGPELRGVAADTASPGTRSCSFCGREASFVRFGFLTHRPARRFRRPG